MTDFTDYTETAIRDWMSQGTTMPSAPGTLYIGLHTADPTDTGDSSTEVSASDYTRESVTTGTGFATPSSNSFENANEIAWSEATNDWGTISHVAIWDDTLANGGNCLANFSLDSNKTISTGDQAKFNAGNLSFSID